MPALLDSKGDQHEAQMAAALNADRERPVRHSRKGMKVSPKISEISQRSILGVHTAVTLIRHCDQIHSTPRKITRAALYRNVA